MQYIDNLGEMKTYDMSGPLKQPLWESILVECLSDYSDETLMKVKHCHM